MPQENVKLNNGKSNEIKEHVMKIICKKKIIIFEAGKNWLETSKINFPVQ
jgi:hypothetical protein